MNESSTSRRRFAPALAALSLWISAGGPAWAAEAGPPKVPSPLPAAERATQQAAFQAYTDAWSAPSDAARLQRLTDSLAVGMTYQDATTHAEGVSGVDAMIGKFQHQSPGVTLKLDDLMLWADHGLARWSMMDPKGGLIMHGYDVVTYDPAGRIKSIVGFFDIPGQRAVSPH
jgi:hypothetical protein